jgi:hypothetical protein
MKDSTAMRSIFLEEFLDASPKSALIIGSEGQRSSGDSVKVCYANRAFLDIIGDASAESVSEHSDGGAEGDLTTMILAKCVRPSTSRFIKWTDTVFLNPSVGHSLRTSFQGFSASEEGPAAPRRQVVDIVWNAVVVQDTYIVLTGKTTGTVSFFKGEKESPESESPHSSRVPVASQPTTSSPPRDLHDPDADQMKSVSSISSAGGRPALKTNSSTSTTYFTDKFTDTNTPAAEKGLDPWRHREKVYLQAALI